MISLEQERGAALKAASSAQISGDGMEILQAFDALTDYLLDHCPDGQNWEDFDPDVDGARQVFIDEYGI